MAWRGDNRAITHRVFRWNTNSLLSSGLLVFLVSGYLMLAYGSIIATGLLFDIPQTTSSATSLWMPRPWWLTGLGIAGVALTIWPVSRWLHHRIDDLIYGQHDNPYLVLSQLNQHLEDASALDSLLPSVAMTLAATLNLPYVAIEMHLAPEHPAAIYGTPPRHTEIVSIPLAYRVIRLGTLRVSSRRPYERLSADDMRLLHDLARQVGITLYAAHLTADLQTAREQLITAREEERRRIRRDLHDGLAPTLAALRMQLGAVRSVLHHDPRQADRLIDDLLDDVQTATADIRRLVYDLRPPMLDEYGLVGAIRNLSVVADNLTLLVDVPATLPPLSAAVEVALYRIATEAVHNVSKHAHATHCTIRIDIIDSNAVLHVVDDGIGLSPSVIAGVGFATMRERATELGGNLTITEDLPHGTAVTATIPLKDEPCSTSKSPS